MKSPSFQLVLAIHGPLRFPRLHYRGTKVALAGIYQNTLDGCIGTEARGTENSELFLGELETISHHLQKARRWRGYEIAKAR